jgi:hypothetical protein
MKHEGTTTKGRRPLPTWANCLAHSFAWDSATHGGYGPRRSQFSKTATVASRRPWQPRALRIWGGPQHSKVSKQAGIWLQTYPPNATPRVAPCACSSRQTQRLQIAPKKTEHCTQALLTLRKLREKLAVLQSRNALFNRRVGAKQLADATGNTKGRHALGQLAGVQAAQAGECVDHGLLAAH